jgi:disulfide bond formation protein DsbB
MQAFDSRSAPSLPRQWFDKLTPRVALALAGAGAALAMASGLFLQHVVGLAPCPLCVLQRVGFIASGLIAIGGALFARRARSLKLVALAAAFAALGGLGVAVWHNWLIAFPPESLSCGRPFEWFNDDFPLIVWLPKIFRGDGDCMAVDWTLLGLSVPQWAVVFFVAMLALLVTAFRRARAAEPPPTIGL